MEVYREVDLGLIRPCWKLIPPPLLHSSRLAHDFLMCYCHFQREHQYQRKQHLMVLLLSLMLIGLLLPMSREGDDNELGQEWWNELKIAFQSRQLGIKLYYYYVAALSWIVYNIFGLSSILLFLVFDRVCSQLQQEFEQCWALRDTETSRVISRERGRNVNCITWNYWRGLISEVFLDPVSIEHLVRKSIVTFLRIERLIWIHHRLDL